jgi:hypothetical protein
MITEPVALVGWSVVEDEAGYKKKVPSQFDPSEEKTQVSALADVTPADVSSITASAAQRSVRPPKAAR